MAGSKRYTDPCFICGKRHRRTQKEDFIDIVIPGEIDFRVICSTHPGANEYQRYGSGLTLPRKKTLTDRF